jgi:hypothetical protein
MPENNTADILDKTEPEYLVVHYEIDSSLVFKPALAVSIGRLTPQELEKFKKRNNIEEFTEERINEILNAEAKMKGDVIELLPPKPKYFLLSKKIAEESDNGIEYIKAGRKYKESLFLCKTCQLLEEFAKSAGDIRTFMRKKPKSRYEWGWNEKKKGLTDDEIADKWNSMSDDERKAIDQKLWKTVASGNTFTQAWLRNQKK